VPSDFVAFCCSLISDILTLYPNTIGVTLETINRKTIPIARMFLFRIMPPSV
jgi:hypothetical protein